MKWSPLIVLLFYALLFPSCYAQDKAGFIPSDPVIQEFVRLVNAKRLSLGYPELTWDGRVAAVALGHSADMVSRHFFSTPILMKKVLLSGCWNQGWFFYGSRKPCTWSEDCSGSF